jgi:iron complex transport system substrate-binding protein
LVSQKLASLPEKTFPVVVVESDSGAAVRTACSHDPRQPFCRGGPSRNPMRVVSLLPSATETLYALGVEPVGVSHSCDHPPAARSKPVVTATDVDPDATPAAIDEQVAAADGPTYDLDRETLAALDPDLVVTQATCEVCAVDSAAVFDAVASLSLDADVLALDPHGLDEALDDVVRVAEAVGDPEAGRDLRASLCDRVDAVARRAHEAPTRPRTVCCDWPDPVFLGGHWVVDLLERAGADPVLHDDGPSRRVRWATVREADPECLLVAPCGFDVARAVESVTALRDRPGWDHLAAVRADRVFALDGNGHVNRPGPRLVDSLEAVAACVHPDLFDAPAPDVARRVARDVPEA